MTLLIGADPEFFIRRRRHFLSAHYLECGTKENPKKTDNGHIQVDGISLECNVTPAATREDFIKNVQSVRRDAAAELYMFDPTAELVARPSIFFGRKRLSALPHENAELGCRADWNAYTLTTNDAPDPNVPFRTGSGHIHIGWTERATIDRRFINQCAEVVRELDYWLGLPSLLWDNDDRRRSLYGKAGAYRPKSYGLEYRTLSNAWVDTDTHIGWVFDATKRAIEAFSDGGLLLYKQYGDFAKLSINNNDRDWPEKNPILAKELLT